MKWLLEEKITLTPTDFLDLLRRYNVTKPNQLLDNDTAADAIRGRLGHVELRVFVESLDTMRQTVAGMHECILLPLLYLDLCAILYSFF